MNNQDDNMLKRDEIARRKIQDLANDGSPKAQAWVQKDQEVAQARADAASIGNKLDLAGLSLVDVEKGLQDSRDRFNDHIQGGAPSVFEGDRRVGWINQRDQLKGEVNTYEQAFGQAVDKATPDDIADLQKQLKERMETAQQAEDERRGIRKLPSEKANEAKKDMLQSRLDEAANDWSPIKEEGNARNGMRTARGYEGYAASAQSEMDQEKEEQARVNTYLQNNLGKGLPTMEQLDQWEAQHSAEQTQANEGQPVPGQTIDDERRHRGASQGR